MILIWEEPVNLKFQIAVCDWGWHSTGFTLQTITPSKCTLNIKYSTTNCEKITSDYFYFADDAQIVSDTRIEITYLGPKATNCCKQRKKWSNSRCKSTKLDIQAKPQVGAVAEDRAAVYTTKIILALYGIAKPQLRPFMAWRPDKYRRVQRGLKLSQLQEESGRPNLVPATFEYVGHWRVRLFATPKNDSTYLLAYILDKAYCTNNV